MKSFLREERGILLCMVGLIVISMYPPIVHGMTVIENWPWAIVCIPFVLVALILLIWLRRK